MTNTLVRKKTRWVSNFSRLFLSKRQEEVRSIDHFVDIQFAFRYFTLKETLVFFASSREGITLCRRGTTNSSSLDFGGSFLRIQNCRLVVSGKIDFKSALRVS